MPSSTPTTAEPARSGPWWSARAAITLRYLAILVPLFLLFTFALERWLGGELREQILEDFVHETELLLDYADRQLATSPDRATASASIASALAIFPSSARVRDAGGVVADTTRPGESTARPTVTRRRGRVAVEVIVREAASDTLGEFRWAAAAALGLTLLLAGGGGYLLAAAALRPVDEIARAAGEIDARSLGKRLPTRPVRDELGRLVETLNTMLARIEQGIVATRQFTQDASHELKTPIAAIKGTAEVALLGARDGAEDEAAFQAIHREAERLERIVRDLLTLARADAGAPLESRRTLDLRGVVEEVGEVGQALAEGGPRLVVELPPDEVAVEGDASRLCQVGLNLVDNAIRYGRQGGTVWVRAAREGSTALLVVEDDGPGIPPAEREHVFERFYRGRRDRAGSGLGLSIARAILEQHGGRLVAGERAGGGARFEARLPLATSMNASSPRAHEREGPRR